MASADLTGLILAAGLGSRFGGGKLMAELDGMPLALHAARTLAREAKWLVAVCNPANTVINQAIAALGYQIVENDEPALGLSHSLALGVKVARGDGLLICLADMPRVTTAHLASLRQAFDAAGHQRIVATSCQKMRSPPVIFPCTSWSLRTGVAVEADPDMLIDVDTQADLAEILTKTGAR
jgi:molybdenum cofactor cytidylyltransferase